MVTIDGRTTAVHNERQVGMFEPKPTRTRSRRGGWAILNSTSFIASWVLMTKGDPWFPAKLFPRCISRGPPPPLPTRDPWLDSDFRDGDDSRPELHNTHASIAAAPESGESRDGTSRWSHARQYEGLRSCEARGLNWGYFRIASLGTLQNSWILAPTSWHLISPSHACASPAAYPPSCASLDHNSCQQLQIIAHMLPDVDFWCRPSAHPSE